MTSAFSVPNYQKPCLTAGLFAYPGVIVNCPDDHLTGAAAARRFGFSRSWCNTQRYLGRLAQQKPCGHYRYRDIQKAEREARESGMVRRGARAALVA